MGGQYRQVIELQPFQLKENKQRKFKGKHLLAYKFSDSPGAGNREVPEVNVLSKALDVIFTVETYKEQFENVKKESNSHSSIVLDEDNIINTTNLLGQKKPESHLSDNQLDFFNSDWKHPARIKGAAGTGKTICLVLKALKVSHENNGAFKILFIVPSISIRNTVEYFLKVNCDASDLYDDDTYNRINVRTIHQVCIDVLGESHVNDTELLHEDSFEAKDQQLLYIMEIVEQFKANMANYKGYINDELYKLILEEDSLALSEILIHEFGIAIKGRCFGEKEEYIKDEVLAYSLPTKTENDRYFIYDIYQSYQKQLDDLGVFDPDDIALESAGRLISPFWRRRRQSEGYDFILVDELHLLNFNELSLIHYLSKDNTIAPISFAVDATQAIGDIAWKNESILSYLNLNQFQEKEETTDLTAMFRCSESITKLASLITSSGAGLFTNFEDPLRVSADVQTDLESHTPLYVLRDLSNESIHSVAMELAEEARAELNCLKHKIVLIYFDRILFEEAKESFKNKSVSCLLDRGDISVLEKAKNNNDFIIAMADYVGGLEFEAVVLVGVDKGRLPVEGAHSSRANEIFQNYTAHNKIYVAITRATHMVKILGDKRRGCSPLLIYANEQKALEKVE